VGCILLCYIITILIYVCNRNCDCRHLLKSVTANQTLHRDNKRFSWWKPSTEVQIGNDSRQKMNIHHHTPLFSLCEHKCTLTLISCRCQSLQYITNHGIWFYASADFNVCKYGNLVFKHGRRDPSCWPRDTLYRKKLALTSPTSGGRSVCVVRSQTQATRSLRFFLK
jgi:hypothetical protein